MWFFSMVCPPFKITEGTVENPGGWCTIRMGGGASEGSMGHEQSCFSRGVVNFHSLYRPLGWYFNTHRLCLCLQRVFIALMALRWLNSLGLRNFYLLVRSINHLDTRLAHGGEINGSVLSPALEPQPQQGQIIPRRGEHLSRGQQRSRRGLEEVWGIGFHPSLTCHVPTAESGSPTWGFPSKRLAKS